MISSLRSCSSNQTRTTQLTRGLWLPNTAQPKRSAHRDARRALGHPGTAPTVAVRNRAPALRRAPTGPP